MVPASSDRMPPHDGPCSGRSGTWKKAFRSVDLGPRRTGGLHTLQKETPWTMGALLATVTLHRENGSSSSSSSSSISSSSSSSPQKRPARAPRGRRRCLGSLMSR